MLFPRATAYPLQKQRTGRGGWARCTLMQYRYWYLSALVVSLKLSQH
jgi:hypothetical protein